MVRQYLLPLKMDHPGVILVRVIWVVRQTNMVNSVDDTSLISMITTTTDIQFGPTDHGTSMTQGKLLLLFKFN